MTPWNAGDSPVFYDGPAREMQFLGLSVAGRVSCRRSRERTAVGGVPERLLPCVEARVGGKKKRSKQALRKQAGPDKLRGCH